MADSGISSSIGLAENSYPKSWNTEATTSVPLIQITAFEHEQSKNQGRMKSLPQLPSHKLRHTVWHELRSTQVKGDELRAPRVREGPSSKQDTFYTLSDDEGNLLHHDKRGKELVVYRDCQESWEDAVHVSLSHQLLNESYQRKNLMRILKRLRSAKVINLSDNGFHDLTSLTFPQCEVMNLSSNYFASFKELPSLPKVKVLILNHNQITDVNGLSRFPQLESLDIFGNGLHYSLTYRQRVFGVVPTLKVLDGTLKLPSDLEPFKRSWRANSSKQDGGCTIM